MTTEMDRNTDLERIMLRATLRQREARRERLQAALGAQGRIVEAGLTETELDRVRAELEQTDRVIRELTARLSAESAGGTQDARAVASPGAEDDAAGVPGPDDTSAA